MNSLKAQCPKCKSDNVELRNRSRFLIRATLCLAFVLLICWAFHDIKNMDFEPPASWALPFVFLAFLFAFIRGFYWLTRAVLIKEPNFKCGFCNNIFKTPIFTPSLTTAEERFRSIRKIKIKKWPCLVGYSKAGVAFGQAFRLYAHRL